MGDSVDVQRLVAVLEARMDKYQKDFDKASKIASDGFNKIERRGKATEAALAKLGKAPVAAINSVTVAAAGTLAGLLSVTAAINGAKAALADFDRIGKAAKAGGLTAEDFQAFAYAAELGGVETDQFAKALEFFSRNAGLAAAAQGDMYSKLKALNPELLKSIEGATDQAERLHLAADAINRAGTASEKAALATALFGREGARMVEVFKGGASVLDETAAKARELGIVVSNSVIANAEDMNDKFSTATMIMDRQFKQTLVDLAPLLVSTAGFLGDMAHAIGIVADQFRAVEDRVFLAPLQNHLVEVENSIAGLRDEIAKTQDFINSQPDINPAKWMATGELADQKKQLEDLYAEAAKYQDRIAHLQGMGQTPPTPEAGAPASAPRTYATPAGNEEAKRIAEVTAALQQQLDALGLTNREQAIASQLAAAHTTAATAEGSAIADLAGKLFDQQAALNAANSAAEFFGQTTYDAFQGIIDGSSSVQDALLNIAKALAEAVLQASLLGSGPLAGIMGTASPVGGLGGLFGSIFSALFPVHHSGGVVGDAAPMRAVSPSVFAGAPRYHSGGVAGLKPDEVPAILQRGEVITPRGGQSAGGGGNTSVRISLSPGLRAEILDQAGQQSVQIVQSGIERYDKGSVQRWAHNMREAQMHRFVR